VIRRSFRFGLKLGLLAGIAFAVMKTLQSRRPDTDERFGSPASWPPLEPTSPPVVHTPEVVRQPAPVTVTPVPEPEPEPEPDPNAIPLVAGDAADRWIERPPAKKAAAAVKKAAKKAAAPVKKAAAKKAAKKAAPLAPWVDPTGGVCPTTHPVKAKLASRIFHLPGMLNYERAAPDRCYQDAGAAEADGLRPAKR
jgi:hypothetical protein